MKIKHLATIIGLIMIVTQMALAQASKIILVNQTGYSIKKVYIAPASDGDFTKDEELLHGNIFKGGQSLEVAFDGSASKWDLVVSWTDGSGDSEWSNIQLQSGGRYALVYDKASDTTSIRKL